jgi:hypothetical protein
MTMRAAEQSLGWIFRVAMAMCFVGHGMFGILTKEEWLPLFAVADLSRESAFTLMPLIGMLDIAIGLFVLVRPVRALVLYMAVWALWTASLRPLSGDSGFELLERAGNYGVALAFLLFLGTPRTFRHWTTHASAPVLTPEREALVWRALSATTVLLLVGHGGLALAQKAILVRHAGLLGFGGESVVVVGVIEIGLALAVLLAPHPALLIGVALWKIATELLYPIGGAPVWEFVERGGSYAAPLALALLAVRRSATQRLRVGRRAAAAGERLGPVAAIIVLLTLGPASVHAQRQDTIPVAPAGILDSLRRGGYVIACRHTETHHDQSDRGATRERQRNLTTAGEEQAKSIGAAIRGLRIPIGEVRANPMYRNQETATYAFGRMVVDSSLGGPGAASALRAMLMAPVPRGTNHAIVTRIGILSSAMKDHGVEVINEGDCFVVRPVDGKDFRILGRLRVQDWRTASSM